MTRHSIRIILSLFASLLVYACSSGDKGDEPLPPDSPARTVLVYMVADNNLGSSYNHFDTDDIDEMLEAAASSDGLGKGRLLVYHGRNGVSAGIAPQLLEITPEGTKVLKTYPADGSTYAVDASRIEEVLDDTKHFAPSAHYGLVLWGHGTGWMAETGDMRPSPRSYGNDRGRWINISDLAVSLEGHNLDFVYFDCCLMGTVEVFYEMRHVAPVLIGSPTEVMGEGMPYHLNVPVFMSAERDIIEAARNTYEYHASKAGNHCQMVVVNTEYLPELASASRAIYAQVKGFPGELAEVQKLSKRFDWTSPLFTNCRPVYDMADYFSVLAKGCPDLLETWNKALEKCVVYKATTEYEFNGIAVDRYCGLGCFLIRQQSDINYRGYSSTAWWTDAASVAPAYKETNE